MIKNKNWQCNPWQGTHERTIGTHYRWEIPARGSLPSTKTMDQD